MKDRSMLPSEICLLAAERMILGGDRSYVHALEAVAPYRENSLEVAAIVNTMREFYDVLGIGTNWDIVGGWTKEDATMALLFTSEFFKGEGL